MTAKSRFRIVHEKGPDYFLPLDIGEMTLDKARDRLDQEQSYANGIDIAAGLSLEKITPVPLTAFQIKQREEREGYLAHIAEIEKRLEEKRTAARDERERRYRRHRGGAD